MSNKPPMNMGLGGPKKRSKVRLPLKTPTGTTPGVGSPLVVTPGPTPTPPPPTKQNIAPKISDLPIALEELTIADKKYKFQAEDLKVLDHLGEGNFGTVMRMLYPKTNTEMAVKKIPIKELRASEKMDIVELAVTMQTGICPYIVGFYGCLIRDGDVWICMELLDSSMDKISDKVYHQLHQTIPEPILGKMTVAVIKALHYLKKELKIIHRDVKPSNVLVSSEGEFKLCDFGISGRLVDSIAVTMEVGCRPYMAPERIDPKKAEKGYTTQSDVWSFGITLLELCLGSFPYGKWTTIFEQLNAVVNGPPPRLPPDAPFSNELREFSAACLMKDDIQRPNYDKLRTYKFFTKYDSEEVDVASWYKTVR